LFNIIIRRAVVATAGAGIALTLMAAPASAAPKADGGERRGPTTTETSTEEESATVTVTIDCNNVATVTSTKDISHVEWKFADGTIEKQEGLSGYSWTRTFDQPLEWVKAKSGTVVEYGYPGDCNQNEDGPASNDDDVEEEDDTKVDNDNDVEDDTKADDDIKNDDDVNNDDDAPEVGGDDLENDDAPNGAEQPTAAEPFKCGDAMATDVNGDGSINALDCTKVLGEVFERAPAAAPVAVPAVAAEAVAATPGAQVLGVQFEAAAAPAALARTGATFAPLLLAAIVLIISGVLMVHGRRRSTNA
jgi:hypothetical protein